MENGCGSCLRFMCTFVLLFVVLATRVMAQGTKPQNPATRRADSSALSGRVVDKSGKALSGAEVLLESLVTSTQYKGMTDASGGFQFIVPPGDYRLLLSAPGYKTFRVSKLPLVSGDRATANPVLEPGDANEIQTGLSTSVTSRTGLALAGKGISDLPENQRNFVNLVQLSTGANEGSENNANTGSRPGAQHQSSAISLGGQPETTNNSTIDGIDNNERINSQIALHPSVDAIAEVQVLANAYPANFGHAGGGVLNVITKSGGDALHGSLYEYLRNDLLDAYPYQFGANNPKPELRQNQFGGSLGGPIRSNGTHFFADYEGFRLIQGRSPVKLTVPTAYEETHPGDFSDVGGPVLDQVEFRRRSQRGLRTAWH